MKGKLIRQSHPGPHHIPWNKEFNSLDKLIPVTTGYSFQHQDHHQPKPKILEKPKKKCMIKKKRKEKREEHSEKMEPQGGFKYIMGKKDVA